MRKEKDKRQSKSLPSRRQRLAETEAQASGGWSRSTRSRQDGWIPAVVVLLLAFLLPIRVGAADLEPPVNFFYESGAVFDVADPVLDDKGPGYYQYPTDRSLSRGMYDLKRFTVYEEGNVLTFVIRMREYINTDTRGSRYGADQGFVGQTFDIYIDTDRKPDSGYTKALPARHIDFANNMGWEKMILVTPLSHYRVYDLLKNKTDDLEFQNWIPDIILPDYVSIQSDRLIIRINKDFLGKSDPSTWGFQLFVMGFSPIVSTNQMLNMDVKAFASNNTFGGGWDTYGDPPIMDCLAPEGEDQRTYLREYRSEPFQGEIQNAVLPFVWGPAKNSDAVVPMRKNEVSREWTPPPLALPALETPVPPAPVYTAPVPVKTAAPRPAAPARIAPPNIEFSDAGDPRFPPVVKSTADLGLGKTETKTAGKPVTRTPANTADAFLPIKPSPLAKPVKKSGGAKAGTGFISLKK